MIRRSLREWDYLRVAEGGDDDSIPRCVADSLIATARASGVGGEDGATVLADEHRRVRAKQVVGILSSSQAILEILPKIDGLDSGATRAHLVHMLARVLDLDVASGAITDLGWQRHDLLEILIRLFCDRLFEVVHRGLPRRYVGHEGDLATLRGRLDAQRQFTVLACSPQRLACRYEDLSAEIPLNQIIKAAVARLAAITRAGDNQRRLSELAFAFAEVSTVPVSALRWDRVVLDRTNSAWATLLNLAKLLLGDRFQTTSSGDSRGFSLLFEMNTLFEEFIGRTLARALSGSGLDVRLQGPRNHALIADDGARRFVTKPDIVVSRDGAPVLIIDTKWKRLKGAIDDPRRGVGQADIYQMMAYSQVYRCDRLMLLYPHHDGIGSDAGVLSEHCIIGTADSRICVASVDLADLAGLGARVSQLAKSSIGHSPLAA